MSTRDQDNLSEDSFSGFEEDDVSSDQEIEEPKKKRHDIAEKDSEEEELERLVLGSKASFREHLFKDDFDAYIDTQVSAADAEASLTTRDTSLEGVDDSALFYIDAPVSAGGKELAVSKGVDQDDVEVQDAPAWEDSDDERLTISLASASQLRKLRTFEGEDLIDGVEYSRRLRQQYLRLYPKPEWVLGAEGRLKKKRRRRSSVSSVSSSASESSSEVSDVSALPLEKFLRDTTSFAADGPQKKIKLRPETINIQRTRDIPDVHNRSVNSLSFHPQYPVLLSSSTSSVLHLHHIAPTAYPTPNPSLTSVQLQGTPIRKSEFVGPDGDEIILAGRRKFFHRWHLPSGAVNKISQIQGHEEEQKTTERFRTSPCGRYLALVASDRKGGGMLNILNAVTMQWVAQARLDGRGGVADFAWWRTGDGMTILGKDGGVCEWSLSTKRAVGTWRDAGSVGGTVIALGGQGGPSALGQDRWVALGSISGILNVYDRNNLLLLPVRPGQDGGDDGARVKPLPEPNRAFEQLITPITAATFSPDGQLLAFASEMKKDAFKLVHLPSCTVYRNWPTDSTPLGRVTAVSFGRQSDMLAVGNDQGKIRLWQIRN